MSFFRITERARGSPPPAPNTAGATAVAKIPPPEQNVDLLGLELHNAEASGGDEGEGTRGGGMEGGSVTKGVGDGVIFEGLSLPAVVQEDTRAVDTENASVEASVEVRERCACLFFTTSWLLMRTGNVAWPPVHDGCLVELVRGLYS